MISGIEEQELQRWIPLCRDSLEYIESRLKCGVSAEDNVCRISSAAAALAYYSYSLTADSALAPQRFKAGDVEIEEGGSGRQESAKALWLSEKEKLGDLLKNEGFYFGRIIS